MNKGVTIAPMLVPALKMPVASARSLRREPFGHRLDAGGEIARFADAEPEAHRRELGDRVDAAVEMCAAVQIMKATA